MPLGEDREAKTHFELHRAIQNVIERIKEFPTIHFAMSEPEYPIPGDGFADLVVFDRDKFPWLTIETKATTRAGDPYNPKVINQALSYASSLGSSYFATCDGQTFVLFDNKERGVPFWERKRLPPYDLAGRGLETFVETLLRDIIRMEAGESKWSGIDQSFVWRLKFLHERFVPYIERALRRHVKADAEFRTRFEKWLEEKGVEPGKEADRKTAVEAAYILINRILFYKVLEAQYGDTLPKLRRFADPSELSEALANIFKRVTDEIDYEAVYEHGLYSEIPLPPELAEIVNEFLEEAASYDLSTIQSDVLGRIYEGLIPPLERKDLGQYYTPPPICDLLVRMCVDKPTATVLDPGCGSGGFLIKAYYRLLQLSGKAGPDAAIHKQILGQLYGVDISQFPAHLSVINLALRDITAHLHASEVINVYPLDFFRVEPRQSRLAPHPTASLGTGLSAGRYIPMVDAVVCNPPYTRQDDIGDETYRDSVRDVALSFNGTKIELSREAGIYAYFFTHATHFLKDSGRMGFIVSNAWMDARYGSSLKTFFLDNFRIHSILEFDRRAFEDAAINTVNIVLEKLPGFGKREERDATSVKFVRVKNALPTEEIVARVNAATRSLDKSDLRVTIVKQARLRDDPSWSKFLRAPPAYFALLQNPKTVPLSELADVNVGLITYANSFFIMPRKEAKGHWGIETRFLRPIITSPRDVRFLDLQSSELTKVLFYDNLPKDEQEGTQALRYIDWGERVKVSITRGGTKGSLVTGYHRIPSLHGRPIWYSVGQREAAPILFPRLMGDRLFAIRNEAGAFSDHQFYELRPKRESWTEAILGCLNSTPGRLCIEAGGRTALGEGVIELMKGEIDRLPLVNLTDASTATVARIGAAYRKLEKALRGKDPANISAARSALDEGVFTALGLSKDEGVGIRENLEDLHSLRTNRARVEVLVDHPERVKATTSRPKRRKLSDFAPKMKTLNEFG